MTKAANTTHAAEAKVASPSGKIVWQWRTSTLRWLSVYAPVLVLSVIALVGFIEYSVSRAMESTADSGIRWQLRYFDSTPDADLEGVIDRRLESRRHQANYYGLFAANGRWIAGDIAVMPAGLALDDEGEAHSGAKGQTLTLAHDPLLPVVRAMGERRRDGRRLVVAHSLTDVRHVRDELVRMLVAGGLVCLLANLAAGVLLSVRQMRRLSDIRRVTALIASGDLNQRLIVGGRDELDMLADLVNRMLDEVERLMGEVKSTCDGIAHDLRAPLVRLRLQIGNLSATAHRNGGPPLDVLLDKVRTEADSILLRFNAMLRIAEIGTLRRRSSFGAVALEAIAGDLYELYEPLAAEKAVSLTLCAEPAEAVQGDRSLLFEALSNLLENAIKFTPAGGAVRLRLWQGEFGPIIEIADDGPGIPTDEREAVLKDFYRAKQTSHIPGTGIGLGIVAAIVRLHDFELRLDGAAGGTVATIECWPHSLLTPAAVQG
ncbi:MAG TPA: HAMP domain-containing sensor histidine kinase [Paraburkholderia sp.]